jgi:hypothetical protein
VRDFLTQLCNLRDPKSATNIFMRGRGIARSFGLRDACRLSMAAIPARLDASIFDFFSQSIGYSKPADSGRERLRLIAVKAVRVTEF